MNIIPHARDDTIFLSRRRHQSGVLLVTPTHLLKCTYAHARGGRPGGWGAWLGRGPPLGLTQQAKKQSINDVTCFEFRR